DRVVAPVHRLEGRAAQVTAALAFDLDHVGAVVGQHLRAHRAHHDLAEVDHAHAAQRQCRRFNLSVHTASTVSGRTAKARANSGTSGLRPMRSPGSAPWARSNFWT